MTRRFDLTHPGHSDDAPRVALPRAKRAGIQPGLAVGLGAVAGLFFGHPVIGALGGLTLWWVRTD